MPHDVQDSVPDVAGPASAPEAPPRLLSNFRRAAGAIKCDYSDFQVEEIPLYPFDGVGTHTLFLVEKSGLSTMQAVHDIANALNIRRRDIGYAGLKDSRAVTRQWMSVEHVDPSVVQAVNIPRIRILETTRHRNKLRLGHLRDNRFVIQVRDTEPDRLAELQDALATLVERGVPNYFGSQRFGTRGDSWQIGRAILRGDLDEALDLVLGRPTPHDVGAIKQARRLYEQGRFVEAGRAWPNMFRDERRALKALAQSGKRKRAFLAIDQGVRQFYVSAYQSHLFNEVLAQRLPTGLDRLLEGDLAWIHGNGAVFKVVDTAAEQPRADRFEISPTGPLYGYRMTEAEGEPGRAEAAVLASESLTAQSFRTGPLRIKGLRRPLRFKPLDAALQLATDLRGPYLELRFALPRGCYATALLSELFHEGHQGAEAEAADDDGDSE